eukprot:CAMPEP_0181235726 /NCGR_PEP_ID=MMETSP1096-20121128/37746_1 /TAXON_ID=156174 ORGANISM="Chrysochromulina ericina, Strain CCMP281" /NCGR_SAMPLE_ID=MMETSP1096 /ASSEMBLY_ACC=CAM_ASM_000453 /LENGTH=67 /DNA_ID=CAMNT_0023330759 /DNA_START=342 /DNA_END=545 /DNA_ORIENTATION=+
MQVVNGACTLVAAKHDKLARGSEGELSSTERWVAVGEVEGAAAVVDTRTGEQQQWPGSRRTSRGVQS